MRNANFTDKVFDFTQENGLFSAPCHLVVAVSGGPDSMALLHTLMHWPHEGLRLSVVHMNHKLRTCALQDEEFLRDFCSKNDLRLTVFCEDVADYATQHKLSLEEAGRQLRYLRFEELRQSLNADYIVTAHTSSDQIETMLMHLIRGCGLDALCGIPAKREHIRRPMLSCSREEILAYCAENAVPYVVDETNLDRHFTRNRIRHDVLPLLRGINPSVDDSLLRFQRHISEDVYFLDTLAQNLINTARCDEGYQCPPLADAEKPLRRRAIRLILRHHALKTIEEAHICAIEHLLITGQGKTLLPGRYTAVVRQGVLRFSQEDTSSTTEPFCYSIAELPITIHCGEDQYTLSKSSNQNVYNLFANSAIDYDTIQGNLVIRNRQEGDTMRPAGRGICKSIKKLMNEWGIPAEIRDRYPLLCDDNGILLVPRYACDQRAVITNETSQALIIQKH